MRTTLACRLGLLLVYSSACLQAQNALFVSTPPTSGTASNPFQDSWSSDQPSQGYLTDSLTISSTPPGLAIVVSSLAPWLFVGGCPNSGGSFTFQAAATPAVIPICVDGSTLKFGNFIGLLEATALNIPTLRFPIYFNKTPTGDLLLGTTELSLSQGQLSGNVSVRVNSNGLDNATDPLGFTAATAIPNPPEGPWLQVSPSSSMTPGSIAITADPSQLHTPLESSYEGTVIVKDTFNTVQTVDVKLAIDSSAVVPVRVFPWIAVGVASNGTYASEFFLVNSSSSSQNFQIQFFGVNGQPINVPIAGGSAVPQLQGTIAPHGTAHYVASSGLSLITGWGLVTADSSVYGSALYRNHDAYDGRYYEASVPLTSGGTHFVMPYDATIFPDTGVQFYTGFVIVNMNSSQPATISCTVRDQASNVIPNGLPPITISAYGYYAGYLFPNLSGTLGSFDCSSPSMMAVVGLRFIGNDAFSSLPVFYLP